MRKFTKEIKALIASAAVSAATGACIVSAPSEGAVDTAEKAAVAVETVCTTTEIPPLDGEPMPPDEFIQPTTTTIAGTMLPQDPTEPTTEEEFPPLVGDIAPADGDINGDGEFGTADVVMFQKWLMNTPDTELYNWMAADMNMDGALNVFDLVAMKRELINSAAKSDEEFYSECKIDSIGYSKEIIDLNKSGKAAAVITSADELNTYLSEITSEEVVERYLSLYDEKFFGDNVLLVNCKEQSCSGGIFYKIDNVYHRDDMILIEYSEKYPNDCYLDAFDGVLMQIVVPKENFSDEKVCWIEVTEILN